jgi:outer membrane protein TolC
VIDEKSLDKDVLVENDFQYGVRKDFQYLSETKKLTEFNVKRYQLSYLPTISMSGNASKNAMRTKFDFFEGGSWFNTTMVSLNVNLPLFNGFARDARVKKTKIELNQIENQLGALKNNIDNEITQAKLNYMSSMATMQFQKKEYAISRNGLPANKKEV